ncbi:DUF6497 family protein [Paracoccus cavernae]|uniref:DUF6497 family protein n=1 Tax=Paracoccus cavernae TaxID=1571207 RepID=A0ABT8D732_9RHOB|nr:DUF6497 family protein [Paracoccus cavernae]
MRPAFSGGSGFDIRGRDPAPPASQPASASIDLPSGAKVYLQETLEDNFGDYGLTLRYRFVMPDLADRVPSSFGTGTDFGGDEPLDIDTQSMEGGEDSGEDYIDDGLISPEDLDFQPVFSIPGAEEAADQVIDHAISDIDDGTTLPAVPDVLLKDPIHDDIVWICDNIALPEALKSAKRPAQIVVSLADRESEFGSYDPNVLQIFESFSLPKDRDSCEWRPW